MPILKRFRQRDGTAAPPRRFVAKVVVPWFAAVAPSSGRVMRDQRQRTAARYRTRAIPEQLIDGSALQRGAAVLGLRGWRRGNPG